jgi:hypothetical protein
VYLCVTIRGTFRINRNPKAESGASSALKQNADQTGFQTWF